MKPDLPERRPPDGSSDHVFLDGLGSPDGGDGGAASPELRRASDLLGIIGDPTRLQILLLLYNGPKTTLDLLFRMATLADEDMVQQLEFLRAQRLIETRPSDSHRLHELTDLGRRLASVAISLGVEWED